MFGCKNNTNFSLISLYDISLNNGEYGANSASCTFENNRARYIRITDINDDGSLNDDNVSSQNKEDDENYSLKYGDLLFARTGATVGKTYLYKENDGKCIYAGYLIRFKLDINKVNPIFVYYNTKTDDYNSWIKIQQVGAAQPNINAKKYGSYQIIDAPIELQNEFAEFVKLIDKSKFILLNNIKLNHDLSSCLGLVKKLIL